MKMMTKSVFKSLPSVLVAIGIFTISTHLFAQPSAPGYYPPPETYSDCLNDVKNSQGSLTIQDCKNRFYGGTDTCKEAKSKYAQAEAKTGRADASVLSQGLLCRDCKGKGTMPSYCYSEEGERKRISLREKMAQRANRGKVKDSKKAVAQLRSCPSVAADRVDDLRDQFERSRDRVDDIQQQIEDAKEEILTAQNDMAKAKATFEETIAELNEKLKTDEKEFKEGFSEELKKKRARYDELGSQISELLTVTKPKITRERIEAIKSAQRGCYNHALEQLNSYLKDRRGALTQSLLTTGSIKNLYSTTGKTREEKNADFANKYYTACLRDKNYTDQVHSIETAYEQSLKEIQASISSARGEQLKLIKEISGDETQAKFKEELESLYRKHEAETKKAQNTFNLAVQDGQKIVQVKTEKIQELQLKLGKEQTELAYREAVYGAADEAAAGEGTDAGSDFVTAFNELTAAADSVYNDCGCSDAGNSSKPECKSARFVLCNTNKDLAADCDSTDIVTPQMRGRSVD